jgi:hypothetical protein
MSPPANNQNFAIRNGIITGIISDARSLGTIYDFIFRARQLARVAFATAAICTAFVAKLRPIVTIIRQRGQRPE